MDDCRPPVPPGRGPRLRQRLLARLRRRSIDDRLLRRDVRDGDQVVAARLRALLDPRHRSALADGLRDLLDRARRRNSFFDGVPVRTRELLRTEPLIRRLADELERDPVVNPRGLILADRLLHDGTSPVYWPDRASIEAAVKHVRAALHLG